MTYPAKRDNSKKKRTIGNPPIYIGTSVIFPTYLKVKYLEHG